MSEPRKNRLLAAIGIGLMGTAAVGKAIVGTAAMAQDVDRLRGLVASSPTKPELDGDKQAQPALDNIASLLANRLINQPEDAVTQVLLIALQERFQIEC